MTVNIFNKHLLYTKRFIKSTYSFIEIKNKIKFHVTKLNNFELCIICTIMNMF